MAIAAAIVIGDTDFQQCFVDDCLSGVMSIPLSATVTAEHIPMLAMVPATKKTAGGRNETQQVVFGQVFVVKKIVVSFCGEKKYKLFRRVFVVENDKLFEGAVHGEINGVVLWWVSDKKKRKCVSESYCYVLRCLLGTF